MFGIKGARQSTPREGIAERAVYKASVFPRLTGRPRGRVFPSRLTALCAATCQIHRRVRHYPLSAAISGLFKRAVVGRFARFVHPGGGSGASPPAARRTERVSPSTSRRPDERILVTTKMKGRDYRTSNDPECPLCARSSHGHALRTGRTAARPSMQTSPARLARCRRLSAERDRGALHLCRNRSSSALATAPF